MHSRFLATLVLLAPAGVGSKGFLPGVRLDNQDICIKPCNQSALCKSRMSSIKLTPRRGGECDAVWGQQAGIYGPSEEPHVGGLHVEGICVFIKSRKHADSPLPSLVVRKQSHLTFATRFSADSMRMANLHGEAVAAMPYE